MKIIIHNQHTEEACSLFSKMMQDGVGGRFVIEDDRQLHCVEVDSLEAYSAGDNKIEVSLRVVQTQQKDEPPFECPQLGDLSCFKGAGI